MADTRLADESSSSDSDSDADEDETPLSRSSHPTNRIVDHFLAFLRAGCPVNPSQNYSAVLLLLSSIPTDILAYDTLDGAGAFFDALWSPPSVHEAQLRAVIESLQFIVKRLESPSDRLALIDGQYKQVWEVVLGEKFRVEKVDFIVADMERLSTSLGVYLDINWSVKADQLYCIRTNASDHQFARNESARDIGIVVPDCRCPLQATRRQRVLTFSPWCLSNTC